MENSATPRESVVYRRMVSIYDHMSAQAELVDPNEYFKFGFSPHNVSVREVRVWRGKTDNLCAALQANRKAIDQAIVALTLLESIRRLAKGSHSTPSIYLLGERPHLKAYEALKERSLITGRPVLRNHSQQAQDAVNRLTRQLNELQQRVEKLEYAQKGYAVSDPSGRD